jgi:putative hydrolase of the HAD superfamily
MLGALTDMHAFDRIFTSEQLGCYKAQADGRFFGAIIDHYGVRPEDIIHIGDGTLEMVGANKAGLTTCWLNRAGSTWSHNVRPDCEVRSLIEAASVLGVNVGSGTGS